MAIEKKLLHFKKYSDFNSKKLSANVANTQYTLGVDGAVTSGEPDVKYQSICWIKDVQKIWTHGTMYNCADLISGTNIKTINGESILGSGNIVIESGENIPYLTIEVLEDECTISFSTNTIQYSTDLNTWNDLAVGSTVSTNAGDKVYFKASLTPTEDYGIGTFTVSKKFNLSGNCNSMLFGDNAAANLDLTGYTNAFRNLFYESTTLQSVSKTFLPATTLDERCYCYMFYGCTALRKTPELPATTLASRCYEGMFQDCTALTTAPELPATTLKSYCYYKMFYGCISLTEAPELPATTLTSYCYYYMFYDCISLTEAPELPATRLVSNCYGSMFRGCTALTIAPELPATTLAVYCYYYMFQGCTNLNYIKMLATDISASNCLNNWVSGVSSTGTFVKNAAATWDVTGVNGVPSGWTVEYPLDISGGTTNQILAKKSDITHDTEWKSVKTINGESVLGSGNIVIETDANVSAVDGESTIIDVDLNKYIINTTDDSITLTNNTYYRKTNISSNISINFESPEDDTIFTSYSIEFTTSDTGTTIALPNSVKWLNGNAPSLENNTTYQISVMNNLGVCAKYA